MNRLAVVGLLGAVIIAASGARPAQPHQPGADSTGMRVVLLGTGTPNADPDRSGPAVAVVINESAYLIDAGPGVVRRAAAAARNGIAALSAEKLTRVFITHLHSDHTVGLPDLLLTPWVLGRETPLDVYGPPGIDSMMGHLEAAYQEDIHQRIDGLQPQNATGWRATVHLVKPGVVYRDSNVTVTAFAVEHENWPYAFGYRFASADRVIVISGDTRPTDAVVAACDGCDVLVHEVYSDAGFARRSPDWQRYHEQAHTSASALGALAARARPRLLVLYHLLLWGSTPEELVQEVRAGGFTGRIVAGKDLDVF